MTDGFEKIKNLDGDIENPQEVVDSSPKAPVAGVEANRERFESLMQYEGKEAPVSLVTGKSGKASLMDVVHDLNFGGTKTTNVSTESLIAQTKDAVNKIDAIKETLEAPDAAIRSKTHVTLLENKLQHIDESLRIALSKVGTEFPTEIPFINENTPVKTRVNPIERFLSFLTDGQSQLEKLGDELTTLSINKKDINPVAMLAVQVKVGQISQELELFSNLLNQALQSIKTVMNIQV